ncbi:MAG TPA: hypothetical protein VK573_02985 [Gemmatimonadales bacterium]|nr:hypothetical protein [Gemmatimonadales bacterium]
MAARKGEEVPVLRNHFSRTTRRSLVPTRVLTDRDLDAIAARTVERLIDYLRRRARQRRDVANGIRDEEGSLDA